MALWDTPSLSETISVPTWSVVFAPLCTKLKFPLPFWCLLKKFRYIFPNFLEVLINNWYAFAKLSRYSSRLQKTPLLRSSNNSEYLLSSALIRKHMTLKFSLDDILSFIVEFSKAFPNFFRRTEVRTKKRWAYLARCMKSNHCRAKLAVATKLPLPQEKVLKTAT